MSASRRWPTTDARRVFASLGDNGRISRPSCRGASLSAAALRATNPPPADRRGHRGPARDRQRLPEGGRPDRAGPRTASGSPGKTGHYSGGVHRLFADHGGRQGRRRRRTRPRATARSSAAPRVTGSRPARPGIDRRQGSNRPDGLASARRARKDDDARPVPDRRRAAREPRGQGCRGPGRDCRHRPVEPT